LNYALVLRISSDGPTRNISSTNQFVMERNRSAVDSTLRVRGHTDLALEELKFSGNSQRRRKNFLLFHGTFLLDFNLDLIGELLLMPSQQPEYRAGRHHNEFIMNLEVTADAIKTALEVFWRAKDGTASLPAAEIRKLVSEKYSRAEWNRKF
jgi:lipoate-protein ligase A